MNGPTEPNKNSKSLVATVVNEGSTPSTITVCDTNITWDIEVDGLNNTGSVPQLAQLQDARPGRIDTVQGTDDLRRR